MSMPAPKSSWPPKEYEAAFESIRRDDALLNGQLDVINQRRARQYGPEPYQHRSQYNGGIVGKTSRAFLGRPPADRAKSHLITHHLPVAEELTTALADYMAGKPPQAELAPEDEGNTRAAEALNRLVTSDEFAAQWWNAVYSAGSLGWVFGRVVWNQNVQPHPWIEWVDADNGMCLFENGRQSSILFWDTYVEDKGDTVFRLFQEHTPGQIEYQLYKGSEDNVGFPVDFGQHECAKHLMKIEGLQDGTILKTGAESPTAHMLANYHPKRQWRHDTLLRYYSTSDVSRGAQIFEDIDHNWSQLQHEVEAARGRLFVDEQLLDSDGPGRGEFFDFMRDVFKTRPSITAEEKPTFEQVQFDMRVEQYLTLIDSDIRKAVSALGLSPFTVDMDPQASGDMTATETRARTKRTRATAATKSRMERAHLSAILTAYLELDADLNGYTPPTQPVLVSLPDQIEVNENELINAASQSYAAGIMSLDTAVRKQHPEWTPEQVEEEVQKIREDERSRNAFDPLALAPGDEAFSTGDDGGVEQ